MPKVSSHIGYTFRVGPLEQNQYARVDLTVDQIDTELPIEPQLEDSKKAADIMWEFIKGKVDAQMDDMLDKNKKGEPSGSN